MREIKFRAITTEKENKSHSFNSEWVYGDLVQTKNNTYIHPICNSFETNGEIAKLVVMHEVKTETIGQYTGLKDKNGKEIYEGDILLRELYGSKDKELFLKALLVVSFKNVGSFCMKEIYEQKSYKEWKKEKSQYEQILGSNFGVKLSEVRVIGNIYENPELLEE